MAMTQDIPQIFEGTVEVDEAYFGGQWKNKRLSVRYASKGSGHSKGISKRAVFGVLCRSGKVCAGFIDNVGGKELPNS